MDVSGIATKGVVTPPIQVAMQNSGKTNLHRMLKEMIELNDFLKKRGGKC